MEIEILKPNKMSQTGSSLLRLYQDQGTPILDLLVRESVQNSLDAGTQVDDTKNPVEVSFLTGDFCPKELNNFLGRATISLNRRFPEQTARYLAIRDKYTVGLTGPLNMDDIDDYHYGNLWKLVYDICKPQESAGAGGSWGIGKTVYFRIGIGLVIYYSRIKDDTSDGYSCRLAASLVEDQLSSEKLINENKYTGIAWWGESLNGDTTQPVTDEKIINDFLVIFGIEPFKGEETGTVIIMPYINENNLLNNNKANNTDDNDEPRHEIAQQLFCSVDEYLRIAVQRWYFPRLNNRLYKYGRRLKVYINGKLLRREGMLPLFRYWQNLYNSAVEGIPTFYDDDEDAKMDISVEKIDTRRMLATSVDGSSAGRIAYSMIDKKSLGMCNPDNLWSPYTYTSTDHGENDMNPPLFAFCRKPGMIVSYNDKKWWEGTPFSDNGSYRICIFVLDSTKKLKEELGGVELEEYVRQGEHADHAAWYDYPLCDGINHEFIKKIQSGCVKKLTCSLPKNVDEESKRDMGLGKIMADLILPKRGFGKSSSSSSHQGTTDNNSQTEIHKNISVTFCEDDTEYEKGGIKLYYKIKSIKKISKFKLYFNIGSEASKSISPQDWEDDGLGIPFEINSVKFKLEALDGDTRYDDWLEIESDDESVKDMVFKLTKKTTENKKSFYGISVTMAEEHQISLTAVFSLKINSKNVQPILTSE